MSEAKPKLAPCPFCGKTHTLIVGAASEMWDEDQNGPFPHTETYAVFCDASTDGRKGGCGGSGGHFLTKEEAAEAWNRRSDPLVERVKELEQTLSTIDGRLRQCFDDPITAREAYDSSYQEIVAAALSKARPNTAEGEAHGKAQVDAADLRKALQFYADGHHFLMHDETAWDTVSGEPVNFYEDEAGTATVENGSIAKLALAGHPIKFEDEDIAAPPNSVLEDAAILAGWRAALACHATWGQSGWSSHREQYLAAARKQAAAKEPSP